MLLAISNRYIHYSYTIKRQNIRKYDGEYDRQRQTDYAVKPRERYAIMMHTLYKLYYSYTIAIVISVELSSDLRFDGTICVQKPF